MFDSQKYLSYLSFSPLLSATCFNSFCPRPTLPFFHFSFPFSYFPPYTLTLQSSLLSLSPLLVISPVLIIQSFALPPFLFSFTIPSFIPSSLFIIHSLSSFHYQQRGKKKKIRENSYSYFCSLQTR